MGRLRKDWTDPMLRAERLPNGLSERRLNIGKSLYLRLRKGAGGEVSKRWEYRAKVAGKSRWLALGEYPGVSLADAKAKVERELQPKADRARRGEGDHPAIIARAERKKSLAEPTVKEAAEAWLQAPRKRNGKPVRASTIALHKANLDADICPVIGEVKIRHLSENQAEACINRVVARGKMGQAAQVYKTLRRLIRYSIRPLKYLDHDPLANIPNPKPYNPRDTNARAATDAELRAFLGIIAESDISEAIKQAIELQLLTGARPGEIRELRWENIIKTRNVWRIPADKSKNGKGIDVHLSTQALAVLEVAKRIESPNGYVFTGRKGGMVSKLAMARALARLSSRLQEKGIDRLRPHDLRRTFRTVLARIGIAPHVAERCINHADANPLDSVYNAHDYRPQMIEAWDRAGAHIAALRAGAAEVVPMKRSA